MSTRRDAHTPMKMQTTIYAPCSGTIEELLVAAGDAVDAGDLLLRMRE